MRGQWAPPGAHWLRYFLTGLMSLALAALFAWMAAQGDRYGLPPAERLRIVDGVVRSSDWDNNDAAIYLEGNPQKFWYLSKAGEASLVAREAKAGRTISLTVDVEELQDQSRKYVNIFAVAVEGRVIRSFEQVTEDWRANNRVGYWLIATFGPLGILSMVTAWRLYRNKNYGDM